MVPVAEGGVDAVEEAVELVDGDDGLRAEPPALVDRCGAEGREQVGVVLVDGALVVDVASGTDSGRVPPRASNSRAATLAAWPRVTRVRGAKVSGPEPSMTRQCATQSIASRYGSWAVSV